MKLVRQPKDSNLCGQACVATLGGITLDEAIALCRTKGRTRTKQLKAALWLMGIDSGPKAKKGFPETETAILKFTHPGGKSHWVVLHKKKFYDPASGVFRKTPKWLQESRVTSHLELL